MTDTRQIVEAIVAVLATAALSGCAAQVAAEKRSGAAAVGATEQCYGIARAGRNDCRTRAHVCAGWAGRNQDPGAFIYVPAGTCERIVHGALNES